jgi:hypothetical protein
MHLQILPAVIARPGASYNLDWYYVSILNRAKWALLFGGEQVLWYPRKWGTSPLDKRCPNWDPVRKQHPLDNTNDQICYGTGWVGGYYRPIQIYVSLLSTVNIQNVVQEEGIRKIFKPMSWTLKEPNIRNGDVIVRQNGERYWINNITQTRWKHNLIRQLFETEQVEKNHVLYQIPV